VGVAVGVHHRHDRDAQLDRFGDSDSLAVGVYDKDRAWDVTHRLDAAQEVVQANDLLVELARLGLWQVVELSSLLARLQVVEVAQALPDRLEVGEHTAHPALVYEELPCPLGLFLDRLLRLLLRANEKDP